MKLVVILSSALALTLGCMPPSGGGTKNRDNVDRGGQSGGVTPLGNTSGTGNNSMSGNNSMGGNGGSLEPLCDQACDRLIDCQILDDFDECVDGCMSDDSSEMVAPCIIRTACENLFEVCLASESRAEPEDGEGP